MAAKTLSGSDAVMKALSDIAEKMGSGAVEVGFAEGAEYPDGTPVAAVAFWNEFGDENRPARPFFRRMIAAESPSWPKTFAKLAKATDYDGHQVLTLMGEEISAALMQSIQEFTTPALAASTIAKKGFDKPLIDTAYMSRHVTFNVVD